jgi:hypothetical protein
VQTGYMSIGGTKRLRCSQLDFIAGEYLADACER